jgi:hypothetical protein
VLLLQPASDNGEGAMSGSKGSTRRFAAEPSVARRSDPDKVPATIEGSVEIDPTIEDDAHRRIARKLGKHAAFVQHVAVQLTDGTGADGSPDVVCRVTATMDGRPAVVIEERGGDAALALRRAADALGRTLQRALRHVGHASPASAVVRPDDPSPGVVVMRDDDGSVVDRRVGHARENVEHALERPEKKRRDAFVDTSLPGVSATDREAGYGSTAARNAKRNSAGMTAALEDSRTAPSRKSTRRSANRMKAATPKQRTVQLAVHAPTAEATRARARKTGPPRG